MGLSLLRPRSIRNAYITDKADRADRAVSRSTRLHRRESRHVRNAVKSLRLPEMDAQKEHHRRFHGALPGSQDINLPIVAPRRKIAAHSALLGTRNLNLKTNAHTNDNDIPLTREQIRRERRECHFCQLAKFSTYEKYPITITNAVDDATLPPDFSFIEKSVLCDGVEPAEDAFRTGCECGKDQDCERMGCHCLQDMDVSEQSRAKIYSYISRGPNKDCLRPHLLESRDPMYECHDRCQCSIECNNRVVERGRKIPLEIFRTSDGRGWGVRSTVDIREGQYVDKYVGEIITAEEATRRREESEVAERKDVYLFALDKFSDPDSMDARLAGPPFEVDGEFKSGPTRYINHSCEPNLRSFARVGDHADKHIHDLALFTIQDIPAGEELTFDYVDGADADPLEDAKDWDKRQEMTKCLCGSKNCRGFLW